MDFNKTDLLYNKTDSFYKTNPYKTDPLYSQTDSLYKTVLLRYNYTKLTRCIYNGTDQLFIMNKRIVCS